MKQKLNMRPSLCDSRPPWTQLSWELATQSRNLPWSVGNFCEKPCRHFGESSISFQKLSQLSFEEIEGRLPHWTFIHSLGVWKLPCKAFWSVKGRLVLCSSIVGQPDTIRCRLHATHSFDPPWHPEHATHSVVSCILCRSRRHLLTPLGTQWKS